MTPMKIRFLGATRQVTGSRYYLQAGGLNLMIDCGLFQERRFQERNWQPPPINPADINYLLLTHAHLDHSGLIPRLVAQGFERPIITTPASRDLAEIILTDAAEIQEEDARFKRKRHQREHRESHRPVQPLYTRKDAANALPKFQTVGYNEPKKLNDNVSVTFHDAGHILGSAMLEIIVQQNGQSRTILFSGDVGMTHKPLVRDPSTFERADYVIMESTYGNRVHEDAGAIDDQLCTIINDTVRDGGNIIIPTFAVERAQELMFHLARLTFDDRLPHLLAFLDSPMAIDVTTVFRKHRFTLDEEAREVIDAGESLFKFPGLQFTSSSRQSKAINRIRGSCIIMAGSGMCTAGRIKHHLVRNIDRPECAVVFVGYQAHDTLGRQIVDGEKTVRILGQRFPVKARILQVHGFSAHADQTGLLNWVGALKSPPKKVFLTHGEEKAANTLAALIESKHHDSTIIPEYDSEYTLD